MCILLSALFISLTPTPTLTPLTLLLYHPPTTYHHPSLPPLSAGAEAFLFAEYSICAVFVVLASIVIFLLISWSQNDTLGLLTAIAFVLGAVTSIASGYIGMRVAVYSNVRTTINAQKPGYMACFNTAFRAGSVMGFALSGLGILVLYLLLLAYAQLFEQEDWILMMDCISGYGLGGSAIALFGRVGGGIYTKAADVGADLCGKVIAGIPEDSPRNPATIADNVGDNVGDVAGMGADLFGSFAESTCAALVIAAQTPDLLRAGWGAVCFPLIVSSSGILVCLITSFLATNVFPVINEARIEIALRLQLIVTTLLLIPVTYVAAVMFIPETFEIEGVSRHIIAAPHDVFVCVISGTIGGLVIGLVTEYYTSKEYGPVMELVESCRTGAATNIIYGLALGYKSVVVPVFILAFIIYLSFSLCDLYGVALAAVGMLGNLATGLTIDAYGPVCDNAGGIAEMAELHEDVRKKTDALDAAGNTTAAVGKGFAIGSAALVSLALYGAFVTRVKLASKATDTNVEILHPLTFAFLLIGSMLPYWFSAMTMKSVGMAAMEMVAEVKRQFETNPALLDPTSDARPDYDRCVAISTRSALREMIAPGALVMLAPIITGVFFGVTAVYGLLTGSLLSAVQLAISMSNTGGAWDNCKKYIESGKRVDPSLGGKGSEIHKAAVVGDTVGDPLKVRLHKPITLYPYNTHYKPYTNH
ncbi:vacuolar membrane proton pump, inorganic pyrophosphatase [Ochromonadaceae sp. CCMP2298]|nr:vacuolar membrane proton pump, inorganic pyrophosphatase [Ochromonadaceae sp. CCMP2298]